MVEEKLKKKSVKERGQGNVKGELTKKGRERKVRKGRGVKREKKRWEGASVHNVSERQLEWG